MPFPNPCVSTTSSLHVMHLFWPKSTLASLTDTPTPQFILLNMGKEEMDYAQCTDLWQHSGVDLLSRLVCWVKRERYRQRKVSRGLCRLLCMLLRSFFSRSEVELYEAEELSRKAFLSYETDFIVCSWKFQKHIIDSCCSMMVDVVGIQCYFCGTKLSEFYKVPQDRGVGTLGIHCYFCGTKWLELLTGTAW